MNQARTQPGVPVKVAELRNFILFVSCFYLVWTFRALGPFPRYWVSLNLSPFVDSLLSLLIKSCCWVAPVVLYLKYIDRVNPWDYLWLKANWRKGLAWGLIIGFVQLIFYGLLNYLLKGKAFTFDLGMMGWLNRIILVGILEETLFRGFILQKLSDWMGFWRANSLTSILFMLIHFPGWIQAKSLTGVVLPVSILILGFLFGLAKKYTKSLWAAIVFHSINNFVATAISPFR